MFTKEEFLNQLRDALNHLYNPEHLRQIPLATILGLANRFDTGSALQRLLIEKINALQPPATEPHHSPAWQIYEPLFYRYVEQLSAEEVADQMAISERHLRRKQQTALEVLADALWKEYEPKGYFIQADVAGSSEISKAASNGTVNEELAWLKETTAPRSADLKEVITSVLTLAQKLADHHSVKLEVETPTITLPKLMVDPVALRYMILNLLQVAIPYASGEQVSLSIAPQVRVIKLEIWGIGSGQFAGLNRNDENLKMAQNLANLSGCELTIDVDSHFDAKLIIPAPEQLPVLVIDDNLDALQMLNRYAADTRYHLITSPNSEGALKLAEATLPKIIVLDVMMPHVDGWELFQRFRQHPITAHIPIIVCTILAQKELAVLLGANSFLRKPFSRQDFLDALDGCINEQRSEL